MRAAHPRSAETGQDAALNTPKIRPQLTRMAQRTPADRPLAAPPRPWGPTPHNQRTVVPPESVRSRTPEYKHNSKRPTTAVPLSTPKTVSRQRKMPRAQAQGVRWVYAGCMPGVYRVYSGCIPGACRVRVARKKPPITLPGSRSVPQKLACAALVLAARAQSQVGHRVATEVHAHAVHGALLERP